jgi:hypothetical protein
MDRNRNAVNWDVIKPWVFELKKELKKSIFALKMIKNKKRIKEKLRIRNGGEKKEILMSFPEKNWMMKNMRKQRTARKRPYVKKLNIMSLIRDEAVTLRLMLISRMRRERRKLKKIPHRRELIRTFKAFINGFLT